MRLNRRQASQAIKRREPFVNSTGSLRGVTGYEGTGVLPYESAGVSLAGLHTSPYIVYSYQTPIAWVDGETGQWRRPDVRYSQTTSCHQGLCPREEEV